MPSKALQNSDNSGFEFVKEMLSGADNYAINLDRLMFDETLQQYIIFEFQKCDENQKVDPWTSHPKRYWHLCWRKYQRLKQVIDRLGAVFYVINYAEKGTTHQGKVLVIKVSTIDRDGIKGEAKEMSRSKFKKWFTMKNNNCKSDKLEGLAP